MHAMAKDMELHDVLHRLHLDLVQFMDFKKMYDHQKQAYDHLRAQVQYDLQHQIYQRNVDEYVTVNLCTDSIAKEDIIKGIQFLTSRDELFYPTQLLHFTGSRSSFLEVRGMDDIDGAVVQRAIDNGIRHEFGDLTAHSLQWLTDEFPDTNEMRPMRRFVQKDHNAAGAPVRKGSELVNRNTDRHVREASPQVPLSEPLNQGQQPQEFDELPQRLGPDPKGKRVAGRDALQPVIDHSGDLPPDIIERMDEIMRKFRQSGLPWDQFFQSEPNFELPAGQISTANVQPAHPGGNGLVGAANEQDQEFAQWDLDQVLGVELDLLADEPAWPALEMDLSPNAADEQFNHQNNAGEGFIDLPSFNPTNDASGGDSGFKSTLSSLNPADVGGEVDSAADSMRDLEGQLEDSTRENSNAELAATGLATFGEHYSPGDDQPMFPLLHHDAFGRSFQGDLPEQPFEPAQMFEPTTLAQQLFPDDAHPATRKQEQPFVRGHAPNMAAAAMHHRVPAQSGTKVPEPRQTAGPVICQGPQSGATAHEHPEQPRTIGRPRGRPRKKAVTEGGNPLSDDRVLMDSDSDFHGIYVPIVESDDDDYKPLPKRPRKAPMTGRKRNGPQTGRSNPTPRKRKTAATAGGASTSAANAADSISAVGPLQMRIPTGFVSAPGENTMLASANPAPVAPMTADASIMVPHAGDSAPMPVAPMTVASASVAPTAAFIGQPQAPGTKAPPSGTTKKGQGRKRKVAASSAASEGVDPAITKKAKRVYKKKAAGATGEPQPPKKLKKLKALNTQPLPAQTPMHAAGETSYALPNRPEAASSQQRMTAADGNWYSASQMPSSVDTGFPENLDPALAQVTGGINALQLGSVPALDGRPIVEQVSYPRPENIAHPSEYGAASTLPQLPSVGAGYMLAQATFGGPLAYDAHGQVLGDGAPAPTGFAAAAANVPQFQASSGGVNPALGSAAQGTPAVDPKMPVKRGRGRPPGTKTKKRKTSAPSRTPSAVLQPPTSEPMVSQPVVAYENTAANNAGEMATMMSQQLAEGAQVPPVSVSGHDFDPDLIDPQLFAGMASGVVDQPNNSTAL